MQPVAVSQTPVSLASLEANQGGVIVETCQCPCLAQRLAALGVAPGCCVKMICRGRTCLLAAGRTRLSLRLEDLSGILVDRLF